MDALDELEQMHESARADFQKIATASTSDRAGLWAKLHSELKLHEQIEEKFVYDPVTEDIGAGHPQLDRFHEQHETEAAEASRRMDRIGDLDPNDAQWLASLYELQTMLERHMAEEEQQFWPLIRQTWGEDKLNDAGRSVAAAKATGSVGASIAGAMGKAEQALKGDS
jgi:hemerythrin HHE cation binding domain-containing protein